jgi:hypothetical protein
LNGCFQNSDRPQWVDSVEKRLEDSVLAAMLG